MKKILPFLMILMMLFAFVACDNGNGDNPNPDTPPVSDPAGTGGSNSGNGNGGGTGGGDSSGSGSAGGTTKYTVTYTVSPEGLNVNLPTSGKVDKGTVLNYADLSREYYVFDGWFIGDEKISFPYTVNSDVTITTKFTVDFMAAEESATISGVSPGEIDFIGTWDCKEEWTEYTEGLGTEESVTEGILTVTREEVTMLVTKMQKRIICDSQEIYDEEKANADNDGYSYSFDDDNKTIIRTAKQELIDSFNEDYFVKIPYEEFVGEMDPNLSETTFTNSSKTVLKNVTLSDEDVTEIMVYVYVYVKR